ncbi:MAG: GNAT family N-acetyltransferase, partial [Acidobacteriota bacterium]|nr:GNAT family N-acetyltransferase [Acidobacteriota bacterium]
CSVCPVLDLAGYPAVLDPKLKVDLRRARNKLDKNHRIAFSLATPETLPTALEDFFRLHAARWQSEGETGVLAEAALRNFHREVAAGFCERGLLRLYTLHIDGAAAAVIYAFRAHRTLFCYLSGFDPQFSKLSPGGVLLQHAVESAIAEGLTAVDFLRQPEAYKYLWGARDRINSRLRFPPSGMRNAESRELPAS